MDILHPVFRFVVRPKVKGGPHAAGILGDAHALGLDQVTAIQCNDLYFIEGPLEDAQLARLGLELLSDPVTQSVEWCLLNTPDSNPGQSAPHAYRVEVALRPGVTDPVAEQIVRAARVLGLKNVLRASTGQQYWVEGERLTPALLDQLARRLLSNAVIQRYALGEIDPAFPVPAEASATVETISIRTMRPDQLLACSNEHRAALDLVEMQAIQDYFRREGRDCSDVELECIAQTWSEHCVHKTFKALVTLESSATPLPLPYPPTVNNLLNSYIRKATLQINAPWVISAFSDNAGIIDFDAEFEVSFKVETHNHPSAIEPFGGANTGVGGVIRDVIGVSARPIANTDVLCFGPQDLPLKQLPEGVLHPRLIQSGVIAGVQDYGNKMGIPTVNGAICYDPGFTANPLVFCGCVGLAPKGRHVRTPQVGDRLIILGGRTGRDGLRGATFSSQTMDAQTGAVAGASVQIGDPITEKITLEAIVRARDEGLYHAITDCGAGGLSSAVGEMSSEIGAEVDLALVHLKYPGLAPWEIWLSEAQERMVIAVPPASLTRLQTICELYEVELTDIGYFTGSGRLVVNYAGKQALNLDNLFLHHGLPQRHLKALPPSPQPPRKSVSTAASEVAFSQALLDLLSHPNIASKAHAIRIYDHEVQGGTRVKPLTGRENDGPADACVLKPAGTGGSTGIVLSNGINPEYGKRDPYNMAVSVVDEAIRNAVAVGADPQRIAILDNFCWGDPKRPEVMWSLLEAARGCHDAALAHAAPFISGKDSFNNEYQGPSGQRVSIPPTLLISALGIIADIEKAVTLDLKNPGSPLFLVGEFRPTFGGSHFSLITGRQSNQPTPCASELAPRVYRVLHRAIQSGWVRAVHDLSEGGLGVAAAEMAIAGRLGLRIETPGEDPLLSLFGESNGCLLVEVAADSSPDFTDLFAELPCQPVGWVTTESVLTVSHQHQEIFWLPLHHLVEAWMR